VWHADGAGVYDNEGYKLRGHFFTNAEGAYRLSTVTPGLYPGRTRHFHVKVRPPGDAPLLTTQLYFPGEPGNRADTLYRQELEVDVPRPGEATFDFVVETSRQG
jgi:protocatechuate 3,4-dioxygenase beta subunit